MKRIFLSLATLAILCLPGVASADTITFQAPTTAANNNPNTSNPNRNTDARNNPYQGGSQQFDLDHYRAYTWSIQHTFRPGERITGATLTFNNIANWDSRANRLFVNLLDFARNTAHNNVSSYQDTNTDPLTSSQFINAFESDNPLMDGGTDRILLATITNLSTTPAPYTISFNAAQLARLNEFFSVSDNTLAFGFDPDCHFWNNGITFTINTAVNNAPVPEPATMTLLGTGLAGLYYRRRRNKKQSDEAGETAAA